MIEPIREFRGKYSFLSNFYTSIILYDNVYPTVEHYFQAMKTRNSAYRATIANAATPSLAKKLGRSVALRVDWEEIKFDVMELGLRKKFSNPALAPLLLSTYPAELIEGNWRGDRIWGYCLKTQTGQNNLGRLLMKVRTDLINGHLLSAGPDPVF